MRPRICVTVALPLCLPLAILVVLAALRVTGWTVPVSVALALAVLAAPAGWRVRRTSSRT